MANVDHTQLLKAESSIGAEKLFLRLLPQSVLFKLPNSANMMQSMTSGFEIVDDAATWRKDGILPYPLTATQFYFDSDMQRSLEAASPQANKKPYEDYKYTETVIAWATGDYNLNFAHRLESWSKNSHSIFFGHAKLTGTQLTIENPVKNRENLSKQEFSTFSIEAYSAIARVTHLVKLLTSIEYTASQVVMNRNERRSGNYPKTWWDVKIRGKNLRTEKSMKSQFEHEVRVAHTVRAHHREEHLRQNPSGTISIVSKSKVQSHIRGKGELFQLKDYALE